LAGNSIWKDCVDNVLQDSTSPIFGYYFLEKLQEDIHWVQSQAEFPV